MKIYSNAIAQPEEIDAVEKNIVELSSRIFELETQTSNLKNTNTVSIVTDAILFGIIIGNLIILDYFMFFCHLIK
jgi:hypothetical protein